MNISFSTQSYLDPSNLNFNVNSSKDDTDIKAKSKKPNTINNSNTSLRRNSKKNSALESLMKRKENLENNKSEFMENALKKGEDPKSIKEKLDDYDKQIREIDKQISKLQLDDQRKALGTEDNDKNKKDKNSKQTSDKLYDNTTKTDHSMDNIVALSEGLSKHKTLSQLKNKITGNIRELKSDIEYDEKFRGIDPIASKKLLDKEENGLKNLDEKLNNSLKDINNKIKENLKDNTSNNAVDKNKNSSNIETITTDKLSTKQLQVTEKIKHYSNILDDQSKYNGEKIDTTA